LLLILISAIHTCEYKCTYQKSLAAFAGNGFS